ncbi:MAG: hypothetical protein OEY51_01780, partial [Cyclobacteriaceae bacterium]|nr:hypothetical protein [Cyclobacteriaceae bacterium]
MKEYHIFLFALIFSATLACIPEDERYGDLPVVLSFTNDTIIFDTVFTRVGSLTKRLKVYNPSRNAVLLSRIKLAGGLSSPYNITVNGQEGPLMEDIR